MTTVSNLRPALAASKTGMSSEVGCEPLAAICAWTNSMWSSISTLATFSFAISSASGSTSTEVTELCNGILSSHCTSACLLSPGVRDSLGSHHDRGYAKDRASATEIENVTLVDVVERRRGRVDHPRGEMSRGHILFEFALLPVNGQLHSLSLKSSRRRTFGSANPFRGCSSAGTSRGSAEPDYTVHHNWRLLPASNSFSFIAAEARLVGAARETVVGGREDAVDEFLDEAVQAAMAVEIVAAEQHDHAEYS
jgi:hypothetical protein